MRKKYFELILLFGFLTFGMYSCVDIPGGPSPSVFDFRALVRFVHAAAGKDTIAMSIDTNITRDTVVNNTVIISGSDSIFRRDSIKVTVTHTYYKRYEVNYGSTLEINQDGLQIASLTYGASTTYLNTPAGNRKLQIIVTAPLIDTLDVHQIDSAKTTRFDTVGKGSSKTDTTITMKSYSYRTASTIINERIVADSTSPTLVVETDRKISVFLVHDVSPLISEEGGRVRYGWMRYMKGNERYTFAPSIATDSVGMRFVHTSRNISGAEVMISGSYLLHLTNPDRDTTVRLPSESVGFLSISQYFHSKYRGGVYSVYASQVGGSAVDSLTNLLPTGGHRYTIAVIDSSTTFRLRKYDDD